jgi:uncharacterized protein YraI
MTKSSGTILDGGRRPEGRGAGTAPRNTTALPRLGLGALLLICSAAAMPQNAVTTEPADLYAGPDDAYPVVAQLDPNTPIQVMGCLDDWSWCDVTVEAARGWMYSPNITYYYEGGYVPLYSYAPSLGIAVVPFSVDIYWGRYYHDRPWYSRREEWAHRSIDHRRPPGPPPSAGPPPRTDHREGPREVARDRDHDQPLHLGSAGTAEPPPPPRPNDERSSERKSDEPRPAPASPRPEPRPQPETHALPPAPSPHEEHSHPPGSPDRAAPPPHEERQRPAPPKEKEEDHPH